MVWTGRTLALNRAELVLVYVMLLIVAALCTMGLSEQILPLIKKFVLRFGGASLYQRSQVFFLGLISGQVLSRGIWAVVDYLF